MRAFLTIEEDTEGQSWTQRTDVYEYYPQVRTCNESTSKRLEGDSEMKNKFEIFASTAVVLGIVAFFIFVGHVPNTTNYPRETVAEPSPYGDNCEDNQSLNQTGMTCTTLNALLQPAGVQK